VQDGQFPCLAEWEGARRAPYSGKLIGRDWSLALIDY